MGTQTSKPREELDTSFTANPNTPSCWGLHHVAAIHKKYQDDNYDFGVDKQNFTQLLTDSVPGASSIIDELWSKFDPKGAGLVHALEVVSALAAMSVGALQDKIEFVFSLYDFNGGGDISHDEMVILLSAVLSGVVKITGRGRLPADSDMERLTDEAFLDADHDASGSITKSEFTRYVKKVINADGGDLTVDELLGRFNLSVDGEEGEEEVKEEEEVADGISDASGNDTDSDMALELAPFVPPSAAQAAARSADDDEGDLFALEMDGGGDQFMAVKPYIGAIVAPSNPPAADASEPENDLTLEFVHGYRSFDCRNNVRQLASGELVYHTAALGVVYDPAQRKQRFFFGHTDDIVSLAVHPDGVHVATGEMGKRPAIHIWNSQTMESVACIKRFHKRAVLQLAFSHTGQYLASVGQDDDHSLAVYDWQTSTRRPSHSAKVGGNKLLGVAWTEDDSKVVTVGVKHVAFWDVTGKRVRKEKGLFGKKGSLQPVLCAAGFGGAVVTGTASGKIYVWNGRECQGGAKQHEGAVTSLWSAGEHLYSGGKDGKVKKYDRQLHVVGEFDLTATDSLKPRVRSVAVGAADGSVIVGCLGAEIYVYPAAGGAPTKVMEGHFKGELWALATHPSANRYVTCGDDQMVRVWDADERRCVASAKVDSYVRAAAWSPDGASIAIGTGGRLGGKIPRVNGAFRVLNAETLEVVHQAQDSRRWIEEIKYSPDGATLAVGSHDNKVYLYDAANGYAKLGVCRGHSSYITHLDFTADGASLQTNCGAYELLFWDVATGTQKRSGASELKDAEWASWTCTLGWPVQGIWPAFSDGTDVNSVDRAKDGRTVVTTDDFGLVKLYRYPAVEGALCTEYEGHSSHVTNVRFSHDDSFLVTVGGNDKSVFQWRYDKGEVEDEGAAVAEDEEPLSDEDFAPVPERSAAETLAQMPFDFGLEEDGGGDEFMSVKPYLGAIVEPSTPPAASGEAPTDALELEWVHGYQAQAMRNSLRYTASGEIVYTTAKVGVVYNAADHAQKFFHGPHCDDIISLAISDDGRYVATGELGRRPVIYVWDTATQTKVAALKGHRRGVCALAFSHGGTKLASIGVDDNHSIIVYDWAKEARLVKQKCHTAKVFGVAWSDDDSQLVTVGIKHVAFWTFNGRALSKKKGLFGRKGTLQTVMTVAVHGGRVITGQQDGSLYVWDGRNVDRAVEAHGGCVYALYAGEDALYSGGRDGKVYRYDADLNKTEVGSLDGQKVRSVCSGPGGKVLVGTSRSQIVEIEGGSHNVLHEGHHYGETWGLAAHPTRPEYATSGDDKWLYVWDVAARRVVRKTQLESFMRAAAYSPDGQFIAVGYGGRLGGRDTGDETGAFRVLNADTLEVVHAGQDSQQWIQDVKFSPDGATLAVASHDCKVYLYNTADWAAKGVCSGHSSYITHMDFSADGSRLQTNCGAYELLFWDAANGQQLPGGASELKDEQWASWTCTLGWPVQGIWPPAADGTDVNAVDRSHSGRLLVTADDFGFVKLFNYPALQHKTLDLEGHSSHVTNARWTSGDSHVITTGGNDRSVFQWALQAQPLEDGAAGDDSDLAEEGTAPARGVVPGDFGCDFDFGLEAPSGGDQFMAVKPWVGAIVPPSSPPADDLESPQADELELEWVHGYRTFDTRNNLFALASGEVAYHTAAVGIVYNLEQHKQRFYFGHTDDIISMALHPDGVTVATGQMGKRPEIHVWNSETMQRLAVLGGFHKRGIVNLSFNGDGSLLLSTGQDNDNKLALYDWANARQAPGRSSRKRGGRRRNKCGGLVGTAKGHTNKILDVTMGPNDEIVAVGVKLVKFWLDGLSAKPKKGVFGNKGKLQAVLSCQYVGGTCVTGTASGHLYLWDGRKLDRAIQAHAKAVNALNTTLAGGLISGGKDGVVKVWDGAFATIAEFNMASPDIAGARLGLSTMPTDPNNPDYFPGVRAPNAVRAVSQQEDGSVLVGTRGSEIFALDGASGKASLLHEGHCYGETWGLAVHPRKSEYVTSGDDKTLRVWSATTHKLLRKKTLESFMRAAAYSPDGQFIAVGYGGRLGGRDTGAETGAFRVLNADTLEVVHAGQDSQQWIQDVKFSPDGATLAVSSHDCKVYLYNTADWAAKGVCQGHSSYITHMDFSADGSRLQTNCGAYELLFWDASNGQQVPNGASELKDEGWASWTCVLGWPVQGIWPPGADGTDINAADRSHDGRLLITADDFGFVKLFNYPCVTVGAECNESSGHSSHVTNARWTYNDRYAITTGGNDQAVFQWRHKSTAPMAEEAAVREEAESEDDYELAAEALPERTPGFEMMMMSDPMGPGLFALEADSAGDQFMAVKPWVGAIVPPSNPPAADDSAAPAKTMQLEWVHGYQAQTTRNSVRFTANGDIVYTVAALGVVYNPNTHKQRFFRGHTDDVISLAVSPDGRYAATGQLGRRPAVMVWDTQSAQLVATLKGHMRRGVPQVVFSPCGLYVACVGLDDQHTLAVYDWGAESLVARGKTGGDKIMALSFAPDSSAVAAVGVKTVATYAIAGRRFNKTKGIFGKVGDIQTVMTCEFLPNGKLVTGQKDGSLYLWEGRKCSRSVPAHSGGVSAMFLVGSRLYTGGADGVVKQWDAALGGGSEVGSFGEKIRSVCADAAGDAVLVGTIKSRIVESAHGEETTLIDGHCYGELWGLATSPDGTKYVTCGDDKTVRVWDVGAREMVARTEVPVYARAAAWSPDGQFIAIGLGGRLGRRECGPEEGSFMVLNAETLDVVHQAQDSRQWIEEIKFSPDGATLAVASHDCKVYLYNTADWAAKGVCSGHSSYITHVDFSADGSKLQSNCGAYELLFWDASNGQQLPSGASELADEAWASWTCTLGWPVQGIWPPAADGTDINAVARSGDGQLLVTADDFGKVKLFSYPCLEPGAAHNSATGHSSHVTNARWLAGDGRVITTGGNDRGVFQWVL